MGQHAADRTFLPYLSRRQLLQLGALSVAATGAAQLIGPSRASAALAPGSLDYTSPKTFDEFYSAFVKAGTIGQATDFNDVQGALAWGQTYVQQGLLRMYEAYHTPRYLETVLDNIDQTLATRDSERRVTDWRGLSLPAWRCGNPYSAGLVNVPDAAGRPSLQVRSVRTPIETVNSYTGRTQDLTPVVSVQISAGSQPGTFWLQVQNTSLGTVDVLDKLTMSTVKSRVEQAWPTQNLITVADLRAETGASDPAPGSYLMASQQVIFAVHTGMISYPIAWAARLITERPDLRRDPRLRSKAEEYVGACEAALAVHDDAWRENDKGEGWYVFPRGWPIDFDGTQLPANQFLAVARTMIHLSAITGRRSYLDRATKMARSFRNQLALGPNGAYAWHYWLTWGWVYTGYTVSDDVSDLRLSFSGAQQAEDISHGHIDLDLAVEAYRNDIVFGQRDMSRLAATFIKNIATTTGSGQPTAWSAVDGTGVRGNLSFDELSAGWMPIAFWDRRVFTHVRDTFVADDITTSEPFWGFLLLDLANIAWFASVGGR